MHLLSTPLTFCQKRNKRSQLEKRHRIKITQSTMVFPSIPVCLDPPSWNQQAVQVHQEVAQLTVRPGGGNMSNSVVRPSSTAERARLAKVPQPEPALNCPRCDSTNTKFCYYNNYSLSQPRHFCKACRRYWTRGGALRNVPVGGGCRKNKRTKSSASTASSAKPWAAAGAPSSAGADGGEHQLSQLPFMGSLHPLPEYVNPNLGLSFGRMQPSDAEGRGAADQVCSGLQQQNQQLPFMGGLEGVAPAAELYSMVGDGSGVAMGQVQMKASSSGLVSTQLASVKMLNNSQSINFSRQYDLSFPQNMDNFWGGGGTNSSSNGTGEDAGAGWTDLLGFNSSSAGNLL